MGNFSVAALTGATGGTNIPIENVDVDATEITLLGRGPAGSPAPNGFRPFKASTFASPTEFDHILSSRADLVAVVAPVGGVFTLPAGSYFIKSAFALNAGEGLAITNANVLIMGDGAASSITGGSAAIPLLSITGTSVVGLLTLQLIAAVADVVVLDVAGDVVLAMGCLLSNPNVSATNPICRVTSNGRLTLDSCRLTANNRILRCSGNQKVLVFGSRLESVVGTCVEVDAGSGYLDCSDSIIRTTGVATGQAFFLNSATHNVEINSCEVATTNAQVCCLISANGIAQLQVRGGQWQTNTGVGTTGISINGPISKTLLVDGVHVQNCANWVSHAAGAVAHCMVHACTGSVNVTTCVNWNVANIPSRGLFEHGNAWNAASGGVFNAHAQNDARVSRRSNHSSTALLSESAIVP